MRKIYVLIILFLISCQQKADQTMPVSRHHIESLTAVFDAHGGYQRWDKMKTLSYTKGDENTVVNLKNRKIRLESQDRIIGFDGNDVWVYPDSIDASGARFYHNLFFYFYTMPFVVGDPGAFYEDMGQKEILGKTYHGVKVSYADGVGDAPDDNYILWVDPKTNQMEWLMYTVTYRSGAPNNNYSLIRYSGWSNFSGLILPTSLQWYSFENDTIGEPRGAATIFQNVTLSMEAPEDSLFERPLHAKVAPRNK